MGNENNAPLYSKEAYESFRHDPESEGGIDVFAQLSGPSKQEGWKKYKLHLEEEAGNFSLHKPIWTGDEAKKQAVVALEAKDVISLETIRVPDEFRSLIVLVIEGVLLALFSLDFVGSFTRSLILRLGLTVLIVGIFIVTTIIARRTMVPALHLTTSISSSGISQINLRARGVSGPGNDQELARRIQQWLHNANAQDSLPELDNASFWAVNRKYALIRDGMVAFIFVLSISFPSFLSPR